MQVFKMLCVVLLMAGVLGTTAGIAVAEACQNKRHDGSNNNAAHQPVPAPDFPQSGPHSVLCGEEVVVCDNQWYEFVPAHLRPGACTTTGGTDKCCKDVWFPIYAFEVTCVNGGCGVDTTKPVNMVGGVAQPAGGSHVSHRSILVGSTQTCVTCTAPEEGKCCP
jgi:hypothetical protein